jgi:mRNA interferase RelE/StbE
MPANTARRIIGKIDDYAADPASQANNVTAASGFGLATGASS